MHSFFLPGSQFKFAALVGKKLGLAHVRNRQKRWAREAFRRNRAALPIPGTIVLRLLKEAPSYHDLERAFLEAYQVAVGNQSFRGQDCHNRT